MIYSNPFIELSEERWNYLNHRTLQELQALRKEMLRKEDAKAYFAVLSIISQREKYASQNLLFHPEWGRNNG